MGTVNIWGVVRTTPVGSFVSKIRWWASKMRKNELKEIMTIAWVTWFCRNKLVYGNEITNSHAMTDSFLHMVASYEYRKKVIVAHTNHVENICSSLELFSRGFS